MKCSSRSVITKVDAQTERGFKQYLGRALREFGAAHCNLDQREAILPPADRAKRHFAAVVVHHPQVDRVVRVVARHERDGARALGVVDSGAGAVMTAFTGVSVPAALYV